MIKALVSLLLSCIVFFVWNGRDDRIQHIAFSYGETIEREINAIIRQLDLLKSFQEVHKDKFTFSQYNHIGDSIFQKRDFVYFTYLPNGIFEYIYPPKKIKRKFNLYNWGDKKEISFKASKQRDISIFIEPLHIMDDKLGIIIRNPVSIISNESVNFEHWGFINALIDVKEFLSTFNFKYNYMIMVKNGDNEKLVFRTMNYSPYSKYFYKSSTFKIKNLEWTIYVERPVSTIYFDVCLFMLFYSFVFISIKYAERKRSYDKLIQKERFEDSLTGLYNSRKLSVHLDEYISKRESFLILYMDLNDFKPVNDTYGHDVGDELLKAFSGRLSHLFSNDAFVSRIGGDEFVMVFKGEYSANEIDNFIKRIKLRSNEVFKIDNYLINVSTSIGYAAFPIEKNKKDEVIKLADSRMYQDKNGRV